MASFNESLLPETLRSIDSATFTGSYQALGTPLVYAARAVKWTNNSNKDVTLSWNGTVDHDFVPAGSSFIFDVASNKEGTNQCYIAAGTQFYVKGAAGTGLFYMSSYHA